MAYLLGIDLGLLSLLLLTLLGLLLGFFPFLFLAGQSVGFFLFRCGTIRGGLLLSRFGRSLISGLLRLHGLNFGFHFSGLAGLLVQLRISLGLCISFLLGLCVCLGLTMRLRKTLASASS